jgi:hypothetical protein
MDPIDQAQAQDSMRPLRLFVGALNGALNDQSYAGQDSAVYNPPNQFTVVGPYGTGVDGKPIAITRAGGLVISPALMLVGLGVAVAMLWKH